MRLSRTLAHLVGLLGFATASVPHPVHGLRRHIPSGRLYGSRSRYMPGGRNRNCGERGISPKLLVRRRSDPTELTPLSRRSP